MINRNMHAELITKNMKASGATDADIRRTLDEMQIEAQTMTINAGVDADLSVSMDTIAAIQQHGATIEGGPNSAAEISNTEPNPTAGELQHAITILALKVANLEEYVYPKVVIQVTANQVTDSAIIPETALEEETKTEKEPQHD